MNTPRSKPLIRYPMHKSKRTEATRTVDGTYAGGLTSLEFQAAIGRIVTDWSHLEEMMIAFMGQLLSDDVVTPARQIFRSVNSTQARIAILRSLLEESHRNKDKGPEYDDIINEFESLTAERNNYVHGLWFTNAATDAVSRSDPSITHEIGPFMTAKRGGSVCLNSFPGFLSGASAGVRPPRVAAAG
jgi:hypothetical protein